MIVMQLHEQKLEEWAGASRVTIALVFTDIVDSTALSNMLGNEGIGDVRRAHFNQARSFIAANAGYEIKTIGDSFMAAFHTAIDALNFALSLHSYTGHEQIRIRAGIHVGPVHIVENDLSGKMVNFTARLVGWPKSDWVVLSNNAKEHIEDELGANLGDFSFFPYEVHEFKGFPGPHRIWSVEYREKNSAREINTESLTTYLHGRFPDREHASSERVSDLARQLKAAGYMTLGDIEQAIKRGWSAFLAYEPRRYVGNDLIARDGNVDLRLSDVGAIRSLFYIVDENFRVMSGERFSASMMERIEEARALLKK